MEQKSTIKGFVSGVHNLVDNELIPKDAASSSIGWITRDGKIELMYGRRAQGNEGGAGKVVAKHTGYKTTGVAVDFQKVTDGTTGKVQYLNGTTWVDVITGLDTNPGTFSNYASLAGNFVYYSSPTDGIFKIVTANPGSYADVYDATKNFKGYNIIDKGRMLMWGLTNDYTGLYGSYIDAQNSTVYTTVNNESQGASGSTNYTGTLNFKAGNPKASCFGVTFTSDTQTITVGYDGNVSSGGTGIVNFMTGAFDITFNSVTTNTVRAHYQWENSSAKGVTDFSKSATRLAGEGFVLRQDQGGDGIKVVIPFDGSYFSFKGTSVYQLTLDAADTNPTNELIRTDIGVKTLRSAIGTSVGIVFMNTGNPSRPMINILQRNPVGDNFLTTPLFEQFKFSDYVYDDVVLESWDKYVVMSARRQSLQNNQLLMCDMVEKTVDVAPYGGASFSKNGGYLYMGDSVSQTSYEMFTGFDDMGLTIHNEWISAGEKYGVDTLKKTKKYRYRGQITPDQRISVYTSLDDGDWQLIGTILGDGNYVDYNSTTAIGTNFIGSEVIGGDGQITVYSFLMEIKARLPKFRKRKMKFIAQGYGYAAIQEVQDHDIWMYEDKLPKQYRLKQNVSLDGETTDMDNP